MKYTTKAHLVFFIILIFFAPVALAQMDDLTSSIEIGLTISGYQYKEPNVTQEGVFHSNFCTLRALNIGLDYIGTLALDSDWFMRGDVAIVGGGANYSSDGSGTMKHLPNWYIDTRALFGRNFASENFALAPYIGLGYRYLYNDSRGMTSSVGRTGLLRESNYFYAPIGFIYKLYLTEQARLVTTVEFDGLLIGKQISSGITNTQKTGYGSRLSIMYQLNNWSVGPYLTYWHINDSDCVSALVYSKKENKIVPGYIQEPKNYTIEAGLKISYRF